MLLELLSGRLPQYDAASQQLQATAEPAWIGECLHMRACGPSWVHMNVHECVHACLRVIRK